MSQGLQRQVRYRNGRFQSPAQKMGLAIYLMSTNLKGVTSMKLHRDLGITQKAS